MFSSQILECSSSSLVVEEHGSDSVGGSADEKENEGEDEEEERSDLEEGIVSLVLGSHRQSPLRVCSLEQQKLASDCRSPSEG